MADDSLGLTGIELLWPLTKVYGCMSAAFIALGLYFGGLEAPLVGMALGTLGWPLGEYVMHRFVQHGGLLSGNYVSNHRKHHADPTVAEHFIYRLEQTLPIVPFILAESWLVTWEPFAMLATSGAILLCYVANEWVHFAAHRPALTQHRPWLQRLT